MKLLINTLCGLFTGITLTSLGVNFLDWQFWGMMGIVSALIAVNSLVQ